MVPIQSSPCLNLLANKFDSRVYFNYHYSQLALEVMISQLKEKNCIREISLTESEFFSRVFLVKKSQPDSAW
jgi:hypothetical protein